MPIESVVKCDCGCGTVRQQSNNWIQAEIDEDQFRSWKWDDKRAKRKGMLFLATEECCHKLYSRWLANRVHKPQDVVKPFVYQEVGGNENQSEVQVEKE